MNHDKRNNQQIGIRVFLTKDCCTHQYIRCMLEITQLQKKYHASLVIDVPHLILEKGIYWLKGVNGSGKTTLLKAIAGLLPFDGDIRLHGTSLHKQAVAYRQGISWAEAEPLYPPFLSGIQLIHLYESIKGKAAIEIPYLMDRWKMKEYLNHKTSTYSAGMTKKLSLLLAFIGRPALVLLDEPLITLDADALSVLTEVILQSHATQGTGFLMSSHQPLQGELTMAGRGLTIHQTRVISE